MTSSSQKGIKVKDIPGMYSVSIDQAKRLSRYHNILKNCKEHISSNHYAKLEQLGLKSLLLSPYVKLKDWETNKLSAIDLVKHGKLQEKGCFLTKGMFVLQSSPYQMENEQTVLDIMSEAT